MNRTAHMVLNNGTNITNNVMTVVSLRLDAYGFPRIIVAMQPMHEINALTAYRINTPISNITKP